MRSRFASAVLAVLCVVAFACGSIQAQTTWYVDASAPSGGSGGVGDPFNQIQQGIASASNGHTVLVAPGTYVESPNFLGKLISVSSIDGPSATTIVGRVLFQSSESLATSLIGFTVTGANGGLDIWSSPSISNCDVSGVYGPFAVRCQNTNAVNAVAPHFSDCRINGNTVSGWGDPDAGGAIRVHIVNLGTVAPTFVDCEISQNATFGAYNSGGGFSVDQPSGSFGGSTLSIALLRCRVANNMAPGSGAGIFAHSSASILLDGCTLTENQSFCFGLSSVQCGTALSAEQCGQIVIRGCEISRNVGGTAIWMSSLSQPPEISNCTISDNIGGPVGGAFIAAGPLIATVRNSIFWGNSGSDFATGNIYGTNVQNCNIGSGFTTINPTNISADPLFVNPAIGDYHLSSTSPCINAGNAIGITSTLDIDGGARVDGSNVDIGADEVPPQALPGSGEDLDLFVLVENAGDPMSSSVTAFPGDSIHVRIVTIGGAYVGAPPFLGGELFTSGFAPGSVVGYPDLWLHPGAAFLIYGFPSSGLFTTPGLSPQGLDLFYQAPIGLAGYTLRLQALAISPFAPNGIFVASNARDVVFQ